MFNIDFSASSGRGESEDKEENWDSLSKKNLSNSISTGVSPPKVCNPEREVSNYEKEENKLKRNEIETRRILPLGCE